MHHKFFQKSIKIITPFLTYLRVKSLKIYDAQEDAKNEENFGFNIIHTESTSTIRQKTQTTHQFLIPNFKLLPRD